MQIYEKKEFLSKKMPFYEKLCIFARSKAALCRED